jgi:hypothetical protein
LATSKKWGDRSIDLLPLQLAAWWVDLSVRSLLSLARHDVRDPDRGDKAPTFDPDTDEHYIGLSVRWSSSRIH